MTTIRFILAASLLLIAAAANADQLTMNVRGSLSVYFGEFTTLTTSGLGGHAVFLADSEAAPLNDTIFRSGFEQEATPGAGPWTWSITYAGTTTTYAETCYGYVVTTVPMGTRLYLVCPF